MTSYPKQLLREVRGNALWWVITIAASTTYFYWRQWPLDAGLLLVTALCLVGLVLADLYRRVTSTKVVSSLPIACNDAEPATPYLSSEQIEEITNPHRKRDGNNQLDSSELVEFKPTRAVPPSLLEMLNDQKVDDLWIMTHVGTYLETSNFYKMKNSSGKRKMQRLILLSPYGAAFDAFASVERDRTKGSLKGKIIETFRAFREQAPDLNIRFLDAPFNSTIIANPEHGEYGWIQIEIFYPWSESEKRSRIRIYKQEHPQRFKEIVEAYDEVWNKNAVEEVHTNRVRLVVHLGRINIDPFQWTEGFFEFTFPVFNANKEELIPKITGTIRYGSDAMIPAIKEAPGFLPMTETLIVLRLHLREEAMAKIIGELQSNILTDVASFDLSELIISLNSETAGECKISLPRELKLSMGVHVTKVMTSIGFSGKLTSNGGPQ